jgi:hypothetical protein
LELIFARFIAGLYPKPRRLSSLQVRRGALEDAHRERGVLFQGLSRASEKTRSALEVVAWQVRGLRFLRCCFVPHDARSTVSHTCRLSLRLYRRACAVISSLRSRHSLHCFGTSVMKSRLCSSSGSSTRKSAKRLLRYALRALRSFTLGACMPATGSPVIGLLFGDGGR